jgi:hypothetical protein
VPKSKPDRDEFVDVTFDEILRQTDKAFLVEVDGSEEWIAKSQVDNADELEEELRKPPQKREGLDTISVPRWIAIQNGWLDEE